jgi:hypothetical protein
MDPKLGRNSHTLFLLSLPMPTCSYTLNYLAKISVRGREAMYKCMQIFYLMRQNWGFSVVAA